jgi:hypothetical protein
MPASLRVRLRGSRTRRPATPVEYVMLGFAAVVLITLVFLALGRLVDDQMNCDQRTEAASSAPAHC